MNQNDQMLNLKPCPFCGGQPELPSGEGTWYEMCCSDCGQSQVSIQISDLMTMEERQAAKFDISWHEPQYIERAKQEAIKRWNSRHVNETPKNEHDSDDVLKLEKLVRLTEYELVGLMYDSNALPECQPTQKELIKFAEFVQTAFLKKNGG